MSHDIIFSAGERPVELHVVCAGLVACRYEPCPEKNAEFRAVGLLPNVDFPNNLDFSVKQVLLGFFFWHNSRTCLSVF